MKRHIFILSTIGLFALVAVFNSCKKNSYTNTDQLANLGSATISGHVYARLVDTIGAADTQYVPANTVIKLSLNTSDLLYYVDSNAPYAQKYYSASVKSDGSYSVTIAVSKYKSAIVQVAPASFNYNLVKQGVGDSIYTVNKTFSSPSFPVSLSNDTSAVQDIYYFHN